MERCWGMSSASVAVCSISFRARFRDVVLPREHGSWPLALEPVALGLLVAPSAAGVALGLAVTAGFFARRPLKIAWRERDERRRNAALVALGACAAVAVTAFGVAVLLAGVAPMAWLLPFAVAGGVFLFFDVRNGGREEPAEIAGAAAFASVSGAIAALAGEPPLVALALLVAMIGRAVPSVIFVRACVRGGKTGEYRIVPALLTATTALAAGWAAWRIGAVNVVVPVALALLLLRAAMRLSRRSPVRARTLGFQELAIGIAYIAVVAASWGR